MLECAQNTLNYINFLYGISKCTTNLTLWTIESGWMGIFQKKFKISNFSDLAAFSCNKIQLRFKNFILNNKLTISNI